jgi:hypothetical protein
MAHLKPIANVENAGSRGDNFDEDLQAVIWMRERSLERSMEKGLKKMSEDDIRLVSTPMEDPSIPVRVTVPEAQMRQGGQKMPLEKNSKGSAEILEDLLDESQRSQKEIEELQHEAHEKLRILSKLEAAAADREDRHKRKSDRRRKREQRPSEQEDVHELQKSFSKQTSPSRVAASIHSAAKVLMEARDKKESKMGQKSGNETKSSHASATIDWQLEPDLEVKGNVDPAARHRYLVAVQLLHRRIIQKQESLSAGEKAFLQDLLKQKGDDESTFDERILEIESTVERLDSNQRLFLDPFALHDMDYEGSPSSTLKDDHKSDLYIDVYSVNSSASGGAVEATLGSRANISGKKRAKVEITQSRLNYEEPPQLINDEDYDDDDLKDSSFPVLGADSIKPRLLKVRLMEALRGFLPFAISEQNFWLKFSLERDGCSLKTLLYKMRGSQPCLMVIQAKGDENLIFGAFTSTEWGRQDRWFGNGQSFLFRKKDTLEVYPYTGADDMVQYCSSHMVAVGGGDWNVSSPFGDGEAKGIGLLLDGDLQGGESYSCATFCNPCLSHKNEFSILNIEVWTLTPCMTEIEAEKLHQHKQLVEANRREATY